MKKKGFKIVTFLLSSLVFVLIFFSFTKITQAGCTPYCCDEGPRAGSCPLNYRRNTGCHYESTSPECQCFEDNGSWRVEKGYANPSPRFDGDPASQRWCCSEYYVICDAVCGNGTKESGEACDYTATPTGCSSGNYCTTSCTCSPLCGNGSLNTGEECDPPNNACTYSNTAGTCTSGCKCCTACSVSCPSPLVSNEPVNPPHLLSEYFYDNIDSCTDRNICTNPQTRYADCYEVLSPQPTVSLIKHPEGVSTYLGFVSSDHTGGGFYETDALGVKDNTVNDFFPYSSERYSDLNNLFYMEATFEDTDTSIESTYVWLNKSGTKPITPMYIDLNNDTTPSRYGTHNKEEFGFLLHHNSGVWTPYIPAISGDGDNTGDVWKKATSTNGYSQTVDGKTIISIPTLPGTNGIIAKVLIDSVTYSNNGKKVVIRFSLSFKDTNTSLLSNRPNEGNYKIWLMGNDTFGFTPYDNYEDKADIVRTAVHNKWISNERIRYYDQWSNTSQSWNLNFLPPQLTFSLSPIGGSDIEMEWTFPGNIPGEYSNTVINLYKSEGLNIDPILINVNNNGGATAVDVNNNFIPEVDGTSSDRVGSLIEASNHYLLKITGGSGDGNATLTLNNVGQGILYFTTTVFDKGGNVAYISKQPLDLRDWLITQGGLLYSNTIDINVDHGTEAPAGWEKVVVDFANAGLSTELIGIKSIGALTNPSKSAVVKSYMITPYFTPDPDPGYYISLHERFNKRRQFMSEIIVNLGNIDQISGSLSSLVVSDTKIALVERSGIFTVRNSFVCDRQGIFFVNGDLLIEGKILNGTGTENKDACIFIVAGKVTIGPGTTLPGNLIEYDQVNGYILSDGQVILQNDVIDSNGLYISGGIHSKADPGVTFARSLKVADRLRFPALVVNHHSKYGMLAGRLFGNERIVQSTEVGLKPY